MQALRHITNQHPKVAFLIGNGPNLAARIMPSWKDLLTSAADRPIAFAVDGLTNTEVYDLVELYSEAGHDVKERVRQKLELLPAYDTSLHARLMDFARDCDAPVLTTNFDEVLERSVNAQLYHIDSKGFTRFYPWKTYYGFRQYRLPTDGFGIWKIHGDVRYKDSIRLGLTDYMGSAERARKLIHHGDDRLFRGKRQHYWQGHQTWLHIWFNLPIVIVGLGYGIDEVFLRWLLIERKRYLNLFREPMNVYYLSKDEPAPGVMNLMQNLGVQLVHVDDYSEIYGN
ncbi:MAG TPA: SIR2 family protein [Fluviicola sp.]|nr:SIR2 family protein [Fluviicola sp.]